MGVFQIATRSFVIPRQIYGREEELSVLNEAFHWASLGSAELVLLSGPSGIGKTALIEQAFKPALAGRCHYASGKFDQIKSASPYEPIIRCFRHIIQSLLTLPDAELEKWTAKLNKAVGPSGAVIAEFIPEIKVLLGEIGPYEDLPSAASSKRFEWVFRHFVQVFTQADFPLVLFLDDVQWADEASLSMIDSILSDPECQYVLVIVAYRQQERHNTKRIHDRWLEGMNQGQSIRHLHLKALQFFQVHTIVSESLQCHRDECVSIAQAIYAKSIGNPHFIRHLFMRACEDSALYYDAVKSRWQWVQDKLTQLPDTEGQFHYFIDRIARLPTSSKQLLVIGSCLGVSFSVSLLSAISEFADERCVEHLSAMVREGLLSPGEEQAEGKRYRFSHDQIQLAAYSLLDDELRMNIHVAAGRYLLKHQRMDAADDRLFEVVNHFNEAIDLLSANELDTVAGLNAEAGKKAMKSSAYHEALQYFSKAFACLTDEYESKDHDFTFELHLLQAECAYMCSQTEQAETQLNDLLGYARNWAQRAQVYVLKIKQLSQSGQFAEATVLGLQALRELGVRISVHPTKAVIWKELMLTKRMLNRNMEQLYTLEEIHDPKTRAMLDLVMALNAACFFYNRALFSVLASKFIRWVFKYGSTPAAPVLFASYSIILGSVVGDYQGGYRLCKIALELAERSAIPSVKSKVYVMYYGVVSPWVHRDHEEDAKLLEAVRLGMESGEYVYASFALGSLINVSYARDNMHQLHLKARTAIQMLEHTRDELVFTNACIYLDWAQKMQSGGNDVFFISDGQQSEADLIDAVTHDEGQQVTLYQIYTYKLQNCYIFGNYMDALSYAELAKPYESLASHSPHLPIHHYYEALAIAAAWTDLAKHRRRASSRRFKQLIWQFRKWSRMSPCNFEHQYELLLAEWANMKGQEHKVIKYYDRAINLARERKSYADAAIACERAAQHHLHQGRDRVACGYMQESDEAYGRWGMEAKRKKLREEFPEWLKDSQDSRREALEDDGRKQMAAASGVDLAAIIEALMTLSHNLDLQDVLLQLMNIFIQTTKSEKVCLMVRANNNLQVEKVVYASGKAVHQPVLLSESEEVPAALIQYCSRLEQLVQIEDLSRDDLFQTDPYVVRQRCEQVFCLPIVSQERFVGLVYVEGTSLEFPLKEAALKTMRILSSQLFFVWKLSHSSGGTPDSQRPPSKRSVDERLVDPLTNRELEVLNLMATGLTNKEIAIELGVTAGTVKVHAHNIFSKLNVNRRTKAIAEGKKLNLLS